MHAGHVLLLHRDQHRGVHSAHSGRLCSHHSTDRHVGVRCLHAYTSRHHSLHSHRSVQLSLCTQAYAPCVCLFYCARLVIFLGITLYVATGDFSILMSVPGLPQDVCASGCLSPRAPILCVAICLSVSACPLLLASRYTQNVYQAYLCLCTMSLSVRLCLHAALPGTLYTATSLLTVQCVSLTT